MTKLSKINFFCVLFAKDSVPKGVILSRKHQVLSRKMGSSVPKKKVKQLKNNNLTIYGTKGQEKYYISI